MLQRSRVAEVPWPIVRGDDEALRVELDGVPASTYEWKCQVRSVPDHVGAAPDTLIYEAVPEMDADNGVLFVLPRSVTATLTAAWFAVRVTSVDTDKTWTVLRGKVGSSVTAVDST